MYWGVESLECKMSECVRIWEENMKKKLKMFGLEYDKMDVWENFIKVLEWCNGCENILNYF